MPVNLGHFVKKWKVDVDFKDKNSLKYLTYSSWRSMISRCTQDVRSMHYGMSIIESWQSFDVFLHDMGERPSKQHTLDRINNSKGYSPDNCRWALPSLQMANRGKSKHPKSSKYVGVSFHKRDGFWMAYIMVEKKMTYIGSKFLTEIEALEARNNYILEHDLINKGYAIQSIVH